MHNFGYFLYKVKSNECIYCKKFKNEGSKELTDLHCDHIKAQNGTRISGWIPDTSINLTQIEQEPP